ncbi:helix-turn-helix domain-containing protein [Vibrio sp. S4M6]|uniref:GlxA family transcriptional regulator n=1 Tax=Vibrio sinus TaxID=2946865 RepID=UPI00202A1980|nr:helix-turn-helix domain-containing protein [Vibrio sinus]
MGQKKLTITALAFSDAPITSVSGPIEALTVAAQIAGTHVPSIHIVTEDNQPIHGIGGISIYPTTTIENIKTTDVLLIGSIGIPSESKSICTEDTLRWLTQLAQRDIPIASISSGAFVLAKAGILHNRTATTHWSYAEMFRHMFPDTILQVERDVTCDNNYYCTSGVNQCYEVMLPIIGQLFGLKVRDDCHQFLAGNSDQPNKELLANFLSFQQHNDTVIRKLQNWMHDTPDGQFSVKDLSERVFLSERQMKRRFKQATGTTPIRYIQQIRLSIAKDMLEKTKKTIEEIGRTVGYEDTRYFRELFKKSHNMTPIEYRKRYQV